MLICIRSICRSLQRTRRRPHPRPHSQLSDMQYPGHTACRRPDCSSPCQCLLAMLRRGWPSRGPSSNSPGSPNRVRPLVTAATSGAVQVATPPLAQQSQAALAANSTPRVAAVAKGEDDVPTTLGDALRVFFTHPSVQLALAAISTAVGWRGAACGALTLADLAVGMAASAAWILQEWAIHKYLLHSRFDWLGSRIHEAHHAKPYHHISIDGPEIVGPFMAAAALVFWCLLQSPALTATACAAYWAVGLVSYQLTHYLVHTRWVPKSAFMRAVRRHHMLHHLRNHDHWFAFSLPVMDAWLGTAPCSPGAVPLKVVARASGTST